MIRKAVVLMLSGVLLMVITGMGTATAATVNTGGKAQASVVMSTKAEPQITWHYERFGSLRPQVLLTQYQTKPVASGSTNQNLQRVRVAHPSTLRVNAIRITIHNSVDGREIVWERKNIKPGLWMKVGAVCYGECAVTTEVSATTLGRYIKRPHYRSWPGKGE